MPIVPYFRGSVGSTSMPTPYTPRQPDYAGLASDLGDDAGRMIQRYFGQQQTPEQKAATRQHNAAAAVDENKVAEAQAAAAAQAEASSTMDEYAYRSGRAPPPPGSSFGTQPVEIVDPAPGTGPAATPRTPEQETEIMRRLATDAARRGMAAGADPKQMSPVLQAFLASLGDDAGIVRTNSALEGKYLGQGDSPSMGAQKALIEDAQQHDTEKQDAELRLKKYGMGVESADRRYNTDVDAGTQRRGQDLSASTTRRGQDMTDARAGKTANEPTITTREELPAQDAQPAKHKLLGIFGEDRPATPARNKTTITTKRTAGSAPGRPPLSAFGR